MNGQLSFCEGKPLPSGHKLLRLRGQGTFGTVWEAEAEGGGRVALKFVHCNSDLAAALEVRNVLRVRPLHHSNLLRIDAVWADRGFVVLTMELADASLLDLLNRSREERE